MPRENIVKSELLIETDAESIWSCLSSPSCACALFGPDCELELNDDNTGGLAGRLRLGSSIFRLRMRKYDALASNDSCRLALRLSRHEKGVLAVAAASFSDTSDLTAKELYVFLCHLRALALEQRSKTVYRSELIQKCEIDSKPANPAGESHSIEDADDNIRKAPRKRKPHKVLISVIGIAAAAAVAFSAWTYFLPKSSGATSPDLSDISAAVNEQNCAKIVLGMSKSEVDVLLGTQGLKRAPGEYVYRGETLNGRSLPIEQLLVVYGGDICEKITYLQLERASKVGAAVGPDSPIGVLPPSMTRMYSKDGTEYRETHWGYLDPFANFSKSWRGESATIVNTASGETRTRFLTGYDGADPLIISTLEGHPAGKQYTDYDEFLQDKLAFDEALLLRNRYSRGDASRVFGELEEYDAGNGITLSRIPSYERDDDGAPLYTTSVSFDTTGVFSLGSFSNSRLFDKSGMLADCRRTAVAPGMTYSEVRTLVPIVPTALFVNDNFYTVCYGKYLGGTEIKHQFEFVVSFSLGSNVAETIFDNVAEEVPANAA